MGKVVRKLMIWVGMILAFAHGVQSQPMGTYIVQKEAPVGSPVIVYGSANEGKGRRNTYLLEQNNDENPLGNPIETYDNVASQIQSEQTEKMQFVPQLENNVIQENLPQNPKISEQESPQNVNKQIQNTMYVSGGRIYDIQSYPEADVDYIEKPNLNPTITTYPAY